MSSTCDNEPCVTTYLLNEPKYYSPIFNSIPAQSEVKGYLVYELPLDWKKLNFTYLGWKDMKNLILSFNVTSDNLQEVVPIGSEYTAPYKGGNN